MAKKGRKGRRLAAAAAGMACAALLCGQPAHADEIDQFAAAAGQAFNNAGDMLVEMAGSAEMAYQVVSTESPAVVGGGCCEGHDIAGEGTLISFFGKNSNNLINLARAVASGAANESTLSMNVTAEGKEVIIAFKGMVDNVTENLKSIFKAMTAQVVGRQFNPENSHGECESVAFGLASQNRHIARQKHVASVWGAMKGFESGLEANFSDAQDARYAMLQKQYKGKVPDGSIIPAGGVLSKQDQARNAVQELVIADPWPLPAAPKGDSPNDRKARAKRFIYTLQTGSVGMAMVQTSSHYSPTPLNDMAARQCSADAGFTQAGLDAEPVNGILGTGVSDEQLSGLQSDYYNSPEHTGRVQEGNAVDNSRRILDQRKAMLAAEWADAKEEVSELFLYAQMLAQKADELNDTSIWPYQYRQ